MRLETQPALGPSVLQPDVYEKSDYAETEQKNERGAIATCCREYKACAGGYE